MKLRRFISIYLAIFFVISHTVKADELPEVDSAKTQKEELTAIEYLQLMQKAYKEGNYEIIYVNSVNNKIEPKQLIHGVVDGQEIAYFRFLNGAMRESLQYSQKISYFEQGSPSYTLQSKHNRSVFASIANYDYEKGKNSYDYLILGKGRIAGKQAVAIRMISKDEYRYSYIVWLDVETFLPLRLDTINNANIILDQVMVVSLLTSDTVNPWLEKLSHQELPQLLELPVVAQAELSQWDLNWLPTGFDIIKSDRHKLIMHENEPVSYFMLSDGIVNVSIYISAKQINLDGKKQIVKRGATILYTYQQDDYEVNVVGEIPVVTANKLIKSISRKH
ncbi:MucB/RseB C-terminal domain-containing protein [Psychromonas sp. MME1]|uniref:MucB/RseB C-terminal domain-containing protein n=2 Tax=unclassified Psychromonas TaxID=2614957 RepID=UPI0034E2F2DC